MKNFGSPLRPADMEKPERLAQRYERRKITKAEKEGQHV
jgi:hypothetical protein